MTSLLQQVNYVNRSVYGKLNPLDDPSPNVTADHQKRKEKNTHAQTHANADVLMLCFKQEQRSYERGLMGLHSGNDGDFRYVFVTVVVCF